MDNVAARLRVSLLEVPAMILWFMAAQSVERLEVVRAWYHFLDVGIPSNECEFVQDAFSSISLSDIARYFLQSLCRPAILDLSYLQRLARHCNIAEQLAIDFSSATTPTARAPSTADQEIQSMDEVHKSMQSAACRRYTPFPKTLFSKSSRSSPYPASKISDRTKRFNSRVDPVNVVVTPPELLQRVYDFPRAR